MPKIKRRETTAWIKAVAAAHGRKVGEVGYLFVNDERILEVNREYLGHDYYTDIITFDYDEGDTIHGDIVISLDTVRSNAECFGNSSFGNEPARTFRQAHHAEEQYDGRQSGNGEHITPDMRVACKSYGDKCVDYEC